MPTTVRLIGASPPELPAASKVDTAHSPKINAKINASDQNSHTAEQTACIHNRFKDQKGAFDAEDALELQNKMTSTNPATTKLGIFGGTSLRQSNVFSYLEPKTVSTPYGAVIVHIDPTGKKPVVFIQRHHADGDAGPTTYRLPHLINHKANIAAMVQEGVQKIVAVCCVGSLSEDIPVGTVVIPDDYFSLFSPPVSYHQDDQAHVVPGIDLVLRGQLIEALEESEIPNLSKNSAVYVQTVGPRFETKAEVKFLASLGDIVGMTAAHEATVAIEAKKPYAIFAMVDNMANGLAGSELNYEQFKATVVKNQATVELAVGSILKKLLQ